MKHLLNDLTEEEKNSIREQHTGGMNVVTENFSRLINTKSGDVKPLVTEQEDNYLNEQLAIRKLFRTHLDDLTRAFGDDAARGMEQALDKLARNPKNYVVKNGTTYLKSLSGAEIPINSVDEALHLVTKGSLTIDEVIKYFPEKLADGQEFREYFRKAKPMELTIYHKIKGGTRLHNGYFDERYVNWDLVKKTSPSGISNANELNKAIAQTIKDGDVSRLPTHGFKYWGFTSLRSLMDGAVNKSKPFNADPKTGYWSFVYH